MKKILLSSFLLLLILQTTNAQKKKSVALAEPVKITSVEGITEYQLQNGLRVLLFPDPSKSTVTVNITYLVGSRHEGYGESGMAHLLEHLVFKGTPKHPNIPQELTSHGARPNGTTWFDRTNYFETFSATEENLRWALDLESDRMINSYIAKKDLESEFSVVRNEFESGENDPGSVLMERVMSTAFLWHNYGKSTIGSKEDIEKVPIENLQAFYRKYYQPDNAVLMVAGKIDEAKTLQLINEYFGTIPRPARILQPTYTVEPIQDGERHVTLRRVGEIQMAAAGYHIPAGAHADYPAVTLLADILTNEPSGRLYKALVETKKASSVYGFAWQLKDPGYAYFAAEVLKDKSLDDVVTTMNAVFDRGLTETPITSEEVDRARNKALKNFELTYNNSERVGLSLSEYIAKGDWRLMLLYRDRLEKVTVEDVNRVVREYFKPSNRTTGSFVPEANPVRATIPNAPELSELLKDYKGKQTLALAAEFDASPANIMKVAKVGTLPGGARYTLLKKETRGNAVHLSINLYLGSEKSMNNLNMVSQMTASMLKRGTANYSFQQLNDALDKAKSSVNIYGSGQVVGINIQTDKANLATVLNLTMEALRKPVFPETELEKLREERLSEIDQQKSEPRSIAFLEYDRIANPYPPGHVRYAMNFDEQTAALKAVTVKEVKDFYSRFYNGASAVASVVGDFNDQEVMDGLSSALANWNSSETFERIPGRYFEVEPSESKIKTPDKANAMIAGGINLPIREDDDDYVALLTGNYILGGGFLNSRLAVRIRQKEGLSYGVGSFFRADAKDVNGSIGVYAIYNPENSEKLLVAMKDELNRAANEGFTAAELKDAVAGLLQSRNVSRSQDRELVGKLSLLMYQGRTMKWEQQIDQKMAALTVEQVNAAMKKWLKPSKIILVEAGDFK